MYNVKVISKGPAFCIRCGKPARICAASTFDTKGAEPSEFKFFCEDCAQQGVGELPPCRELTASVLLPTDMTRSMENIRRRYQVLDLEQRENLATIGEVAESTLP